MKIHLWQLKKLEVFSYLITWMSMVSCSRLMQTLNSKCQGSRLFLHSLCIAVPSLLSSPSCLSFLVHNTTCVPTSLSTVQARGKEKTKNLCQPYLFLYFSFTLTTWGWSSGIQLSWFFPFRFPQEEKKFLYSSHKARRKLRGLTELISNLLLGKWSNWRVWLFFKKKKNY